MTYLPPANGGRVNVTIGGNTAGAGALVSTGTATLVGGNNITLSQNGNAITISGGAGGAAGSNTIGISNLGNSAGTSGVISGSALQYALAGGNNVTLSQSLNGASGTVTISAANQTVQTQNLVSINGSTGNISFSNANNITFGANASTITASASFNQSVQTQSRFNLTLAGNSTSAGGGYAQISSGVMTLAGGNNITLSQNGNAVTISGGAGGGGGGIALANSETTYTSGTANLSVAGGAMTIASTTGQSFNFSVPQTSSLSATGMVSISTNGSTISLGASIPRETMDFYQNMDRGTTAALAITNNSAFFQRLNQENAKFAADITANTVLMNMSGNMGTASSSSHTVTVQLGIYTDNVTNISLINSVSRSWAFGANTSNSANYHGMRWLSFVSSEWSSLPAFSQGGDYVFGVLIRTSNSMPVVSWAGQNYMASAQRSGSIGVSIASNNTLAQGNYWNGVYGTSTTALPAFVSASQLNRNHAMAIFMPHIILNNRYSGTF